MSIRLIGIRKKFKRFVVLDDVSLEVEPGEFLALLGPSGSGKTTLLRIIAGLEFADAGEVLLEGKSAHERPLRERQVGFVFQHYALFRHMTVFENVAFGLRVKPAKLRPSEQEIRKRVEELLKLVHLDGLDGQYPSQLSGGQRQRVALARVLAVEPRVMLLDEPFGALDAKVRKELRRWLRRLHDEMGMTTIFVTHDQEEAMEIADRVAVMNHGKIVQIGTPGELWDQPVTSFVYDFLGHYNEFLAWKDDAGSIHLCDDEMAAIAEQELAQDRSQGFFKGLFYKILQWFGQTTLIKEEEKTPVPSEDLEPTQKFIKLFVRPFEIVIHKTPLYGEDRVLAEVVHLTPAGPIVKVELERKNGQLIQAEVPKEVITELNIRKQDTVWITPKDFKIFE